MSASDVILHQTNAIIRIDTYLSGCNRVDMALRLCSTTYSLGTGAEHYVPVDGAREHVRLCRRRSDHTGASHASDA